MFKSKKDAPRNIITQPIQQVSEGFLVPCQDTVVTNIANTGSMLPVFDAGHNLLCTTRFKVEELRVGDIVVYSLDGGAGIVHRIHAVKEGRFQFKGDNNCRPDASWHEARVITKLIVGIVF